MVRRGRDRVESRRCGGFYATRWETRAPRERARSPGTLATRAARVSRTGRPRASDVATRRSRPPRRRRARRPRAPLELATRSTFPSPVPTAHCGETLTFVSRALSSFVSFFPFFA